MEAIATPLTMQVVSPLLSYSELQSNFEVDLFRYHRSTYSGRKPLDPRNRGLVALFENSAKPSRDPLRVSGYKLEGLVMDP